MKKAFQASARTCISGALIAVAAYLGAGFAVAQEKQPQQVLFTNVNVFDGKTEDHKLLNGRHFADYLRRLDVPNSKFAFAVRDQQLRYLVIYPKRIDAIHQIELVKGSDDSAPVVVAVTVEAP